MFYITGNVGSGSPNTHYLYPGVTAFNALLNSPIGIPFMQNIIVFKAVLYAQTIPSSSLPITVNLYNTTNPTTGNLGTAFASLTLTHTSINPIRLINFSSTISTNSYLVVQLVTNGSGANISLNIGIF